MDMPLIFNFRDISSTNHFLSERATQIYFGQPLPLPIPLAKQFSPTGCIYLHLANLIRDYTSNLITCHESNPTHLMDVVVVEDDPILAWRLMQQLKKQGYRVVAHFDEFLDAESSIHSYQTDLVITNLKLSDGWVDDHYIEVMTYYADQVLIITAINWPHISDDLIEELSIHQLHKPFTEQQFRNSLLEISVAGSRQF